MISKLGWSLFLLFSFSLPLFNQQVLAQWYPHSTESSTTYSYYSPSRPRYMTRCGYHARERCLDPVRRKQDNRVSFGEDEQRLDNSCRQVKCFTSKMSIVNSLSQALYKAKNRCFCSKSLTLFGLILFL